MTKNELLALIKRKHPQHKIDLREYRDAPNAAKREAYRARVHELTGREKQLKADLGKFNEREVVRALAQAARFVVDVDGDDPSIGKLQAALERFEHVESLREELNDVRSERNKLQPLAYRKRFAYFLLGPRDLCWHSSYECEGDTLDELAAKLRGETVLQANH